VKSPSGAHTDNCVACPTEDCATVQPLSCTLAAYSDAKRLPIDFLKELGLSETRYKDATRVRIPYRDVDGLEQSVRYRNALEKTVNGDNRFSWQRGAKVFAYGLWRIRKEKSVTIIEGESDCHTLWFHGINSVGLPGSSTWNESRDAPHLKGFEIIYVLVEPDQGGDTTLGWVRNSSLRDRIRLVCLTGFKDPSAMHIADPELFQDRWNTALQKAQPWSDQLANENDAARNQAWQDCQELAREPDVLGRLEVELLRAGVVGVGHQAKLLYLALTSRVLDRPISVAVKGPSSAGKNHVVQKVLSFTPAASHHALTAMSEHALAYSDEPLKHRMLVVYEVDGMGENAAYLMRSLLSENCIRYETVEKTSKGLQARLIEREGPTGLIVTTTRDGLHPENETRLVSITVDDSQAQTRAILSSMADDGQRDEIDRRAWFALQDWIALSDTRVVIPFSRTLLESIPPVAVRLRRDARVLLSLIRSHALLHQASRDRDEKGQVIATIADYAAAHALAADYMAYGVQLSVPASVRETVAAIDRIAEQRGSASVLDVADALKLDKSAASRRCTRARNLDYIRNEETTPGRQARYVKSAPLPDDQPLLPHPDLLASLFSGNAAVQSGCTVAGEPEGYGPKVPTQAERSTLERRTVVL
jgi:hypothetical protein